jgi:hypothetical protein
MNSGWTPERRAKQAALIHTWRPWEHSTGPRTDQGKARTAQNGFKGARWLELRQMLKVVNAVLREQRSKLRRTG